MDLSDKIKIISRMAFSPRDMANLIKYRLGLFTRGERLASEPVSLQLEPTSKCNLNCEMCEHSFNKFGHELSLAQFVSIIGQFPYLKNLTLQGLGEPLLAKDLFLMIREAKKRKMRVGLTTNGTLLNEENSGKILDSGLDWMFISLDALDKPLYERIRRGANYEVVIGNIRKFMEMKGGRRPETNFWTLLMKDNINEIPKIIGFADKMGIKKVVLQNIHNWGFENFGQAISGMKNDSKDELARLASEIGRTPHAAKVELFREGRGAGKKCNWPWRSLYIAASGFITPCCMQGSDPAIINFGNVWEEDVAAILNNEKYRNFRRDLKNGCPRVCVNCPAFFEQEKLIL